MPLLDPTQEFSGPYAEPLRRLDEMLERGDLEGLPEPKDPLPGPIMFIKPILPRRVKQGKYYHLSPGGKTLYVFDGDPSKNLELRAEFIPFLLREIFGQDDAQYHGTLDRRLFP